MKKRLCIIIILVIAILTVVRFCTDGGVVSEFSKLLATKSTIDETAEYKISTEGICSEYTVLGNEIFSVGRDILITKQEIEDAKEVYILQGQSEEDAKAAAVKYMEEYNAIYAEAVNNGIYATEEEIEKYIADQKNMTEEAKGIEYLAEAADLNDTESEFWELQMAKSCIIQKYAKALEEEYLDKIAKEDGNKIKTTWTKEYDKVKEKAVLKQRFKEVNEKSNIEDKFLK
ncbi:MAG: hypothetical protein E7267_00745 [Lachnospiraceae bacterium]|nr:hypothetical protein [Lachnospiraceae bacterium]